MKNNSISRIQNVEKIVVKYRGEIVGTLAMVPGRDVCAFQYDDLWLVSGFSISPFELPLEKKLFFAEPTPFGGNFGIFEDSMPDGYGRYLLNRMLRKYGIDEAELNPLQRMSIVGNAGMGALTYEPEMPVEYTTEGYSLEQFQEMALKVLSEKSDKNADVLYYNSRNSGGCRPKILYKDIQGQWIVKFRHTYDALDAGEKEYRFNELAKELGIDVAEYKLLEGKFFASKRFDIDAQGRPLHVATVAALLGEDIKYPSLDYKTLLHLTGFLTQDPRQVEEMFKRMVFNVLAENKDDHAKNFSFIYDGVWRLSPAYDLTQEKGGYGGEHATTVLGNGNPTEEDMLAVAETIRIPRTRAKEIICAINSKKILYL